MGSSVNRKQSSVVQEMGLSIEQMLEAHSKLQASHNFKPRKIKSTLPTSEGFQQWERKGKVKKIKVKKRVQGVTELEQMEKERVAREEANNGAGLNTTSRPTTGGSRPTTSGSDAGGVELDPKKAAAKAKLLAMKGKLAALGMLNKDHMNARHRGQGLKEGSLGKDDSDDNVIPRNHMSFFDAVLGMKVKKRADDFAREMQRMKEAENRAPGVRDWPPWLEEFSKPRYVQARNARVLFNDITRYKKDPDKVRQVVQLEKQKVETVIPKLGYEKWTEHVPMPPAEKREWSVRKNLRSKGDYFRRDVLGWNKKEG